MRCQSQAGLMAFGLSDRWAAKGPDKRTLAGCTSCIAWDLHKVAYCHRFSSCFLHVCAEVLRLMAVWLNTQTTQFSSPCSQARSTTTATRFWSLARVVMEPGLQGNISKTKEMAI
ncbi:hypothetical protein ROHU_028740 [Labeo rohita]|uniref:Uncharacterized protein n=1 Tax=Labeo rohita TaxID=84645 RepID=A0A498M1N8_LABRO|nr:hypothetical protein ROHU_028740 [Labeo rohita]